MKNFIFKFLLVVVVILALWWGCDFLWENYIDGLLFELQESLIY